MPSNVSNTRDDLQKDLLIKQAGPAEVSIAVVERGVTPEEPQWDLIGLHDDLDHLDIGGDNIPLALIEEILEESGAKDQPFARCPVDELLERHKWWLSNQDWT